MKNFRGLFINETSTIKLAFNKMSINGFKTLIVVNNKNKFLGMLSDGDIRKNILKNQNLNKKINNIYNKSPIYLKDNYNYQQLQKIFVDKKIDLIPIIDDKKNVIEIIHWNEVLINNNKQKFNEIDLPVVIMAGGQGKRLNPFTKVLPKPMIPIGDKTILESIIDKFSKYKVTNFYITSNYKHEILKSFVKEIKKKNNINIIKEKKPSGTAGSLSYLKKTLKGNFFLTNCDILVNYDYYKIKKHHIEKKYDLTIVVIDQNYKVPYGICDINKKGLVKSIKEKPTISFLSNTGFYLINSKCLKLIMINKHYDMDEFIRDLIKKKFKIGVYPISQNDFSDYGNWKSFLTNTNNE